MSKSRTILTPAEVTERASSVSRWNVVDQKKLARDFRFPNFQQALDFVNRIGAIAEKQGHHPDLQLGWGYVKVETSTHDAGGITEQDFLLASQIDQLT